MWIKKKNFINFSVIDKLSDFRSKIASKKESISDSFLKGREYTKRKKELKNVNNKILEVNQKVIDDVLSGKRDVRTLTAGEMEALKLAKGVNEFKGESRKAMLAGVGALALGLAPKVIEKITERKKRFEEVKAEAEAKRLAMLNQQSDLEGVKDLNGIR